MRSLVAALAMAAVAALAAAPARAQAPEEGWDGNPDERNQLRADFTLGGQLAVGLGRATAYPNQLDKIDNPTYRMSTGYTGYRLTALWLGGALADWLVVGVGGGPIASLGGDAEAKGGLVLFRVETFPLLSVEPLAELGVAFNFGAGWFDVKSEGKLTGEGGATSVIGVSVFHETLRTGGFHLGPTLDYLGLVSQTGSLHTTLVGARLGWYAGP